VVVSSRPPLPPVTRLAEPITAPRARIVVDEPHTLPGWVAALIYLAGLLVILYAICDRMI
jgi:hypothetical protein